MRTSTARIWQVVHSERRRLAADLSSLPADQWRVPSLCPGWDVHDVLAHLLDTAMTSRLSFARGLLAARLDFDRANENGIAKHKHQDPQHTLEAFKAAADLTRTPPASPATRLVEAIVHGEDIRQPLGITGTYPEPAVAQALAYQLRTPGSFGGGRERAAGLQLLDRSTGRSWGQGEVVEAEAINLLLAVSGRPVARERFTGSGASHLASSPATPVARDAAKTRQRSTNKKGTSRPE
ncbi:maleylpyruvate isomerase family mycothiol-dependent enzyme [Arthrobacter sp. Sa2CUA1]|uniref:Maleylpyruvate isomerase family mycothiol-dependent enzyme n=1 Tax=Arthrobacter gallicola TaxID=2762225 RepID=A0ABR8UVV1_9MICC|nr:maleylpyruvate isomerase family mycothiol-dependent enzyme [Arthrobacter gallicola]MBD7996686.1 maleylpyruvate isomerase family mycothiol-dependent enzyme [Arthrobacter gallicola]